MGVTNGPCSPLLQERPTYSSSRPSPDGRRDSFIRATLQCLAEAGAQGTGLREIGRRANASPGLLRHYFDGKQGLFQECCKTLNEHYLEQIEPILVAGDRTPEDRLRRYLAWYFGPALDDGDSAGAYIAFVDQSRTDPAVSAILHAYGNRHRQHLAAVIGQAVEGYDTGCDPVEAADLAVAVFNGLWLDLSCDGTRLSRDQARNTARTCLEVLLSRRI